MIDHYNAFISYKHAPLDNKVAAHIQSKLEHFHIPGKIRKKTGMKRIQRVFRDKDELPITSDLSGTIGHALENSDYLIVICSYNTCKSEWVKREIEFFLRNHSRKQILAVLAEGEPYEVLPVELTQEEINVVQPDGSVATILREKEPLCCDYRMSFHKADKEELPRLASALIGCSYDELMNRRRAYQMQRITVLGITLTALALGFSGFLINSHMQIQKNYEKSLRNQSIYLANESRQLLASEKRIEAIQLALAALPSEDSNRPVTSEAIRALTDATLAYYPLSGSNIEAVWNYQASSQINHYRLSPEKTSLTVLDYSETITSWDTEKHKVLFQKTFPKNTNFYFAYVSDDGILVMEYDKLTLYSLKTGKKVWDYKGKERFVMQEPCLTKDGDSFYLMASGKTIIRFSVADGEILDTHDLPDEYSGFGVTTSSLLLSPDEKKIAMEMNMSESAVLGMLDLTDGTMKTFETELSGIRKKAWVSNDRVVISNYNIYARQNMYYSTQKVLESHIDRVSCIDFTTGQELWVNEFEYSEYATQGGFLYMGVNDSVAYYYGNRIEIYDCSTGYVLHSYDVNHAVVHINDNDDDGNPLFISEDGAIGSPIYTDDRNALSMSYEFVNDIDSVIVGGGVYVLQKESSQIIYYDVYVSDDEWEELDDSVVLRSILEDSFYLDDDYLAICTGRDDDTCITLYNVRKEKLIYSNKLPCDYGLLSILGIADDEIYVAGSNDQGIFVLLKISTDDGSILEEKEISNAPFLLKNVISLHDGVLTYLYRDRELREYRIACVDVNSGEEETLIVPGDDPVPATAPRYFAETDSVYISNTHGEEYIIDRTTHDVTRVKIPDEWGGSSTIETDSKGERWIVADLNKAYIIGSDGRVIQELETNGKAAVGAMFYNEGKSSEMILLACDDGALYRYDAETAEFIGKSEIETYPRDHLYGDFQLIDDGKTLLFQVGTITDIIDTETWVEVGVVWNSLGYNHQTGNFLAFSYSGTYDCHVGRFRRYTLEDLIQKAQKIVGNTPMSEEQKSQYGIN